MRIHSLAKFLFALLFLTVSSSNAFEARGSGPAPELTAAQKDCVDQYKADAVLEEAPPSREEVEKFFEKCGVPKRAQRGERQERRSRSESESKTEGESCISCQVESEARMNQLEAQLKQLQIIVLTQKSQQMSSSFGSMGMGMNMGLGMMGTGVSGFGGLGSYGMSNMGTMNGMSGMNMMGGMGMMNPMGSMGMMSGMSGLSGMGSFYLGGSGGMNWPLGYGSNMSSWNLGANYGSSMLPRVGTGAGASTLPSMMPYSNYGLGTGFNSFYSPTTFWRGY